jgi:hypothetical protein
MPTDEVSADSTYEMRTQDVALFVPDAAPSSSLYGQHVHRAGTSSDARHWTCIPEAGR